MSQFVTVPKIVPVSPQTPLERSDLPHAASFGFLHLPLSVQRFDEVIRFPEAGALLRIHGEMSLEGAIVKLVLLKHSSAGEVLVKEWNLDTFCAAEEMLAGDYRVVACVSERKFAISFHSLRDQAELLDLFDGTQVSVETLGTSGTGIVGKMGRDILFKHLLELPAK